MASVDFLLCLICVWVLVLSLQLFLLRNRDFLAIGPNLFDLSAIYTAHISQILIYYYTSNLTNF